MFSEEKIKPDVDIFVQGEISMPPAFRPTVLEEAKIRQNNKLAATYYRFTGKRTLPKPVFTRYSSGRTLRQQGKERIYRTMSIAPYLHKARENGTVNLHVASTPQQPTSFPELAGFGEVPVGAANATTTTPSVSRGLWGDLSNILTQVGQVYTTVTTQKYQSEIAQAQAEAAKAKAFPSFRFPFTTSDSGIMSYLPIIALAGGGVLLATMFIKKKSKK